MVKFTTAICFAAALVQVHAFVPAIPKHGLGTTSLSASTTADLLPTIREGVADLYDANEWERSVSLLMEETKLEDMEVIEMALATALNWKGWAMSSEGMRKFIPKPYAPDANKLESALAWLKGEPLSMTQGQLGVAIQELPRVYLVDPESMYAKSLSAAPKEYKDPAAFTALVLEDFRALGNTYNCADGGCASECGNCWVTYSKP
jgi:hypothetical protein